MAKIFYSLSGEGRGHATRVRVVVDALRKEHQLRIFASGMAREFLTSIYSGTNVEVSRVPGLSFKYSERKKVSYPGSAVAALKYLARMSKTIDRLEKLIEREQPDLAIVDFEPLLPRAARRTGIPLVSLDHQHFLLTYRLDALPVNLQWRAALMGQLVRTCCQGQQETIVSSFYFPELRKGLRNVSQIGPLLRPQVLNATPEDRGHLVVYLRRFATPEVIAALQSCGQPVYIYGLGDLPGLGNLIFCPIDKEQFLEHLATCSLLISTAGNQLVGEALFLGKPVLAMPEPGNYEQAINAHFLEECRAGKQISMNRLDGYHIKKMLDRRERFAGNVDRRRLNGNKAAMAILSDLLRKGQRNDLFFSTGRKRTAAHEPNFVLT